MSSEDDLLQFDDFARIEDGFEAVFNQNYPNTYTAFKKLLRSCSQALSQDMRVLDIGCGDGWTAFFLSSLRAGTYFGIDPSAESLRRFQSRMRNCRGLSVHLQDSSAEWILKDSSQQTVTQALCGPPNLIICNAALHQIRKAFDDIDSLVTALSDMVESGGYVLVGEYYFPKELSSWERERCYDWIRSETGQNPTPAEGYPDPDYVSNLLQTSGLECIEQQDVRANDTLKFRYRGVLMQKPHRKALSKEEL